VFEWSHSLADVNEYVLVEAFRDSEAGAAHVNSDHFTEGLATMRPALSATPRIVHTEIEGEDWSSMGNSRLPTRSKTDLRSHGAILPKLDREVLDLGVRS
jgi:hypothetical protein